MTELQQVQLLFVSKYGKEFVAAASELKPDSGVNRKVNRSAFVEIVFLIYRVVQSNRNDECVHVFLFFLPESILQIVELLSVRAPSPEVKLKLLKEIAEEHELDWDPASTETDLFKSHEDLLVSNFSLCISFCYIFSASEPVRFFLCVCIQPSLQH